MLIESMQVQCKIYEEWIEVMSDYSTVFSEGRGVAENYFETSDDQEDSGGASSTTVSITFFGLAQILGYYLCNVLRLW